MSAQTKQRIKLALRRFALRWLRKLVDMADDRLHGAEVKLRNDLSDLRERQHPSRAVSRTEDMLHQAKDERPESETYLEWETRRSGVAIVSKKQARRRRQLSAADFDRVFK